MTAAEVKIIVQDIFRDIFDDKNLVINEKTNAGDIEDWDSLEQINLLTAMEKRFDIKFNIEDVIKLENVGDMITLIEGKVNGKSI